MEQNKRMTTAPAPAPLARKKLPIGIQTFAKLREKGISEESLASCHAPIGMPIGSQTPYEIAVSILAEIIRHRTGRNTF